VAGQGDDVAYTRNAGRLAWGPGRTALFPTQDEEDGVPNSVLDDRGGMAGGVVASVDGRIMVD
jgi:hypothetical protein